MKRIFLSFVLISFCIMILAPVNLNAQESNIMRDFEKQHKISVNRDSDTIAGIINNLITIVQGIADIITIIAQNYDSIINNGLPCNNNNTIPSNNANNGNTDPSEPNIPYTPPTQTGNDNNKFVVCECGAYSGNHSLDHGDVPIFINSMKEIGRVLYRHEKDYNVDKSDFNPNIPVEFVYYAGHGYNGYATLSSGKAFRPRDFYNRHNVRNFVFASCKTVNSDWVNAFKNSDLKSVLGYWGTSWNGYVQDDLIKKFVHNISTIDTSNSMMVIKAWKDANNTGHSWTRKWGAAGMDNTGKARYFTLNRMSLTGERKRTSVIEDDLKTIYIGAKRKINILTNSTRGLSTVRGIRDKRLPDVKLSQEKIRFEKDISSILPDREYQIFNLPSGAIIIRAKEMSLKTVSFNETEALEKAYEFIKHNGGIPDGMKYEDISIDRMSIDGQEKTTGYTIEFSHDFMV